MKKKIIFSAINVTSGGPLTILQRFMEFASVSLAPHYEVWFLVKSRHILSRIFPGIHLMEFPNSQRSVFHKLYYEYIYFRRLSIKKRPLLWFSLNDCSPTVVADMRAVYIHNATPFYEISPLDIRFPSRVVFQKFYYRFFLQMNLRRNNFVIVQQKFMKDFVVNRLGFGKEENVIVNRPEFKLDSSSVMSLSSKETAGSSLFLIYPAKAEVYKNVHTLIDAAIMLVQQESFTDFTLWLTITGMENSYSKYLARKSEEFPQIVFKGPLSFPVLMGHVQAAHIVVFPSRLETWGLPLSEAAYFNKWIVVSDLPYAHETLSGYSKVLYFNPESPEDLMEKIVAAIKKIKDGDAEEVSSESRMTSTQSLSELFRTILPAN
jgi:glycosyltransferase involved in cell wall biosynthesis